MLLTSVFTKPKEQFYQLNLDQVLNEDQLQEQLVDIRSTDYTIQSTLHYGHDVCVIHTKRYNKKTLIELVHIDGPFVKMAYLINGQMEVTRQSETNALGNDKLRIGFAEKTKNKVVIPAHCKTESILIYMRLSYFYKLMENEEWATSHELYNVILHTKKQLPLLSVIQITPGVQQLMLHIAKTKNKHILALKIRELFLELHLMEKNPTSNEIPVAQHRQEKIKSVKAYLDEHYQQTPTIAHLSRLFLLNEMHLKQDFKATYGTTIRNYIINCKMKKASELLQSHTVSEISNMLGYQSVSHFITTFKKHYGISPSQMKN